MKLLIIFNPKAAHGRSASRLNSIRECFKSRGIETHIEPTWYPDHARELVRDTNLMEFDGVVAAGGDGTLFEVLNGLYTHPRDTRVPLGLLPIGTGNAFSREFKPATTSCRDVIDMISRAKVRRIDVGMVRATGADFYFLNVMHMGFAVNAGRSAQKLKFLGNGAYTLATLWQVLKLKSYPLEIEVDGKNMSSDNVFITIANTRYTGSHFLIAPAAKIDDGKLDLIILQKLKRTRLLKLFPTIYAGRHVDYEEVGSLRATHIRLVSPKGMLLGPDGEFRGHTPAEITCLHRDLTVFC